MFEIYSEETESYYCVRDFDEKLSNKLKYFGIWVYGRSGFGKTNSILRYLTINNLDYCSIILAPCYNSPVDECFSEIAYEFAKHVGIDESQIIYPTTFRKSIELMQRAVKVVGDNKIVYIYIDEIPLGHDIIEIKEFSKKFHILLLALSADHTLNKIKFLLSSISNPSINSFDKVLHEKITQYIKFIDIDKWLKPDLESLNEKIISGLGVCVSEEEKTLLLDIQNLSPRFLKRFYKNYLSADFVSKKDFQEVINSTKSEYGNL